MKITKDFLMAKHACKGGVDWFIRHFGEEAEYQSVLDRLAQDNLSNWAEWLL